MKSVFKSVCRFFGRERFTWLDLIVFSFLIDYFQKHPMSWWATFGISFGVAIMVTVIDVILERISQD